MHAFGAAFYAVSALCALFSVKLDKCVSFASLHRQRQVQRGPTEGGGAAAADPEAGGDQRLSGG